MIVGVRGQGSSIDGRSELRDASSISCRLAPLAPTVSAPRSAPKALDAHRRDAADGEPVAIEQALTLLLQRAAASYDTPRRWELRVRAGLSALLDLFDEQPDLAQLCVVRSENAGPVALALRQQTIAVLAHRIDDGRNRARRQPPPQTAHAVLAGAIGAIRGRLLQSGPVTVRDLLDPLMSFIVLPYRGVAAARGELNPSVALPLP
jgi:hypothetical protein